MDKNLMDKNQNKPENMNLEELNLEELDQISGGGRGMMFKCPKCKIPFRTLALLNEHKKICKPAFSNSSRSRMA